MIDIPGLFIVGTDTGVGKTFVASLLIRELKRRGEKVGAYKPACSGCEVDDRGNTRWPDVDALVDALLGRETVTDRSTLAKRVCPQRYAAPAAPPVAARLEKRTVDRKLLDDGLRAWEAACEFLVVEGIGGLLCPVTDDASIADLAVDWKLPLLVVARARLGTINHTLLTVEAAERRGLIVAGIVLNEAEPVRGDDPARFNAEEIAHRTKVPVWGVIPHATAVWTLNQPLSGDVDVLQRLLQRS